MVTDDRLKQIRLRHEDAAPGGVVRILHEDLADLLDSIESLKATAQRRLEDMEYLAKELALVGAARNEACRIAEVLRSMCAGPVPFTESDIAELRKVRS